ncbi:MAG: Enoyl-CoA hydratase [Labilithrix sp.]|nr:Enoyl-CoA hydratase [Labilithrix sp.]
MVPLVTKDFRRTTLRPGQRPIVRALAEALFAPTGDATEATLDAFVENVDGFISPASKTLRFGLVMMLYVLEWSPVFFLQLRPFSSLGKDARVHHLERLDRSKVRQLPLVVAAYKTVLTMLFYEDEAELTHLGYPGPARKRHLSLVSAPPSSVTTSTTEAST